MDMAKVNSYIESFAEVIDTVPEGLKYDKLKVGVDLGTANICIAVLDGDNNPVTAEVYPASVVKDGLVVDYSGAVRIVRQLKEKIEKRLGHKLTTAAAAIPPGTVGKNAYAVSNVIESADMTVINMVDEPTAAAQVLNITDGAVVDVGGGTTGISIIENSKVIAAYDEATGGSHMTLVIAGNYKISVAEAEAMKLNKANHRQIFHVIKPVIEKMAFITKTFIKDYDVKKIYVVGGASTFDGFEEVFEKECGIETVKPVHALLVTPLGIALSCAENEVSR